MLGYYANSAVGVKSQQNREQDETLLLDENRLSIVALRYGIKKATKILLRNNDTNFTCVVVALKFGYRPRRNRRQQMVLIRSLVLAPPELPRHAIAPESQVEA
jgi:hypothetical protein